ncbi:MucR family transcriptional regulator [Erythrobacter aureus]|uniref:Transcriptional regulator n=1 Tax=Erythrobacter aureus TaxID=2182384 RepID=A0A345YIE1_9SPHN|nr:MucR family transcriptional regulator [Erythrobacter aureus]AXK43693.1 transcriptional regulator [Erythrobacter aureus]
MHEHGTNPSNLLLELTADIVAAHVSNNTVSPDELPALVSSVHSSLTNATTGAEEPRPEPAVSIRSSVKKTHITCLDCGKKMKMLKRHLNTEHGLTPEEYRERWGLDADYPIVAPDYAATRAQLAKDIGLGRKPGEKPGARKKRN